MIFPTNVERPKLTASILTLYIEHDMVQTVESSQLADYITTGNVNSPEHLPIYSDQLTYVEVTSGGSLEDVTLVKLNAAILYINARIRSAAANVGLIEHHNYGQSTDFYNICIYYANELYALAYQLSQLTNNGVSRLAARLLRRES